MSLVASQQNPGIQLRDRFSALDAGMNSNVVYTALPRNQASLLINATCRNGFAQQRPGYNRHDLNFVDDDTRTRWDTGRFQGACFFQSNVPQLLASIGGRIFMVRLDTYEVRDVTIAGDPNSSIQPFAYMVQAEQWLIIQDGSSAALIWDGGSLRRSDIKQKQVPTGTAMAYGMGRLWVAVNGNQFVASDIVGGPSGHSNFGFRDAVLYFKENTFIDGGGAFSVPLQSGPVTGMQFVANLNTALGQGALMVFTRNGVFSVQVPTDRTEWQNTQTPLMTVAQINFGSVSPSITPVNGDLFYRSLDGIRSLVVGVRFYSAGDWANTPISVEMSNPLDSDDQALIPHCTSLLFDNRMLMTAIPQKVPRGTAFLGMIALDFNLISSLRGQAPPAYDGVWTGLSTLSLVPAASNGITRALVVVCNASNEIELWELSKDAQLDNGTTRVVWSVDSPGMAFGTGAAFTPGVGGTPDELKRLDYGDLWVDRMSGNVDFSIAYRPDWYPFWVNWTSFSQCAKVTDCTQAMCATFSEAKEQYRPRLRLPIPNDDCETVNFKPFRNFYQMQVRIQVTGFCRIMMCRMFAYQLQEPDIGACPPASVCDAQAGCDINPFNYKSVP